MKTKYKFFFLISLCFAFFTYSEENQRPNIIVIMTDQERQTRHWPKGWAEKNLPSMQRLKKHGISFERAYTSASMCSPSRALILTSQYSPVTKVSKTLASSTESNTLPSKEVLTNLASLIEKNSNYDVVWKGKWHLSYAKDGLENWSSADIRTMQSVYGPYDWNPPDAGNADHSTYIRNKKFALSTLGGGDANNDSRYVRGYSPYNSLQVPGWGKPILEYLESISLQEKYNRKPFCLFISLVNPHDVWVYPIGFAEGGYSIEDFRNVGIGLPQNYADTLKTKPSIQLKARAALNKIAPFKNNEQERVYANFYAYLHTLVDQEIMSILDALERFDLMDNTIIIRTSDHGELAMSHGMREKAYTAYEEVINVPFVVSNPRLFPTPVKTQAFYSHLDLIPTVSDLIGIQYNEMNYQGTSQKPVIYGEKHLVRDHVVFAYDDVYLLPANSPSSHIRALRYENWTYAVYFSSDGSDFEFEMYNIEQDPYQMNNLLYGNILNINYQTAVDLHHKLTQSLVSEEGLPKGMPWPNEPFGRPMVRKKHSTVAFIKQKLMKEVFSIKDKISSPVITFTKNLPKLIFKEKKA